MRLVLDTNIVVAGFLWQGPPYQLVQQAFAGTIELATSPALLVELEGNCHCNSYCGAVCAVDPRVIRNHERE